MVGNSLLSARGQGGDGVTLSFKGRRRRRKRALGAEETVWCQPPVALLKTSRDFPEGWLPKSGNGNVLQKHR